MSISPKRLTKFILTIPFVIMIAISIALVIVSPDGVEKVSSDNVERDFRIMFLIILAAIIILGRKSFAKFYGFKSTTPVKN